MVIVLCTQSYAAAKKLSLQLNLHGRSPAQGMGLIFIEKTYVDEGGFPCNIARGSYDDAEFVSIEYSDAIEGFAKGYYVVLTACGHKSITGQALKRAKSFIKMPTPKPPMYI